MKLKGRYDSQMVAPAEVTTEKDTFRITVKNDDDEVLYTNPEEPYEYQQVPSLATALNLLGAELTDDQHQFLNEALKGDKAGPAVAKLIEVFNSDLKTSAKNNAYQRVFTAHKPLTEENITNANASIVRNFMKTQSVSDETAIKTLQEYGVIPKDFTVAEFRSNKGKR